MRDYNYYVYILTNHHKTVLYVGVTNNISRRLKEHELGINRFCFTARYRCIFLVYYEWHRYINDAIAREKEIKGWIRTKKNLLISEFNKDWKFLNDEVSED